MVPEKATGVFSPMMAKNPASFSYLMPCLLAISIALGSGCAGTPSVHSTWMSGGLAIDGGTEEWKGKYTTIADDQLDVAVSNDDTYLYLSLITATREVQQQVLREGLIVWFNNGGNKDKVFGIHYPLGVMGYRGEAGDPVGMERLSTLDRQQRLELLAERFTASLDELEILSRPDQAGLRLAVTDMPGVEMVVVNSSSRLTYELKIPLQESAAHPYAVGEKRADKVTLGIQTIELSREAMREQMRALAAERGPAGDGYGRRPGGMPGSRPGGMGRGMPAPADPIDTWLQVKLESAR